MRRVENPQVWAAYAVRRRALAEQLAREGHAQPAAAQRLATRRFCYPLQGGALEAAAGEAFLFHGTRRAEAIATSGFDVRYAYAGAGGGALFGHGVYFAESASKADQYVARGEGEGRLTMVLARVCLGRCRVVAGYTSLMRWSLRP